MWCIEFHPNRTRCLGLGEFGARQDTSWKIAFCRGYETSNGCRIDVVDCFVKFVLCVRVVETIDVVKSFILGDVVE